MGFVLRVDRVIVGTIATWGTFATLYFVAFILNIICMFKTDGHRVPMASSSPSKFSLHSPVSSIPLLQYSTISINYHPVLSPLRPGSRASSSSRLSFSGGRIPPFSTSSSSGSGSMAKAAPTTALSGEATVSSPPTSSSVSSTTERTRARLADRRSSSPLRESSATPLPTHSATEGLANVLPSRRPRTTSEHVPSTESNRHSIAGPIISNPIAGLASWSVSIGRRKRTSVAQTIANETGRSTSSRPSTPASELLKKF